MSLNLAKLFSRYEKTLKLPRNDMYDASRTYNKTDAWKLGSTHHKYDDELRQEIKDYFKYMADPSLSSSDRKDAATLQEICNAAYTRYSEEKNLERGVIVNNIVHTVTRVDEKVLTTRHLEDPRTGKCDTAGVIRVPGFFKDLDPSITTLNAMAALHQFGVMPAPAPQPAKISEGVRGIELSRSTDINEAHDIFATVRHVSLCCNRSTFPCQLFMCNNYSIP